MCFNLFINVFLIIIMKKVNKINFITLFLITLFLVSCGKSQQVDELKIVSKCKGIVCSIAVDDVQLNRFTNLLGKNIDREVSRKALGDLTDGLVWQIDNGEPATSSLLNNRELTPCFNEQCDLNSNPTGWLFYSTGTQNVSVKGRIVKEDGTTEEIDLQGPVSPGVAEPAILTQTEDGITYQFDVNIDMTGIPDNSTFNWYINGKLESQEKTFSYTFTDAGSEYEIKLVVDLP